MASPGGLCDCLSQCMPPLWGPTDQLYNLGFEPRYSFRGLFVNPLNCDKILFTEGLSLEIYRSPSVIRVLLLLLHIFRPCSLACSYSCISAIHSFPLETAPSLQHTTSLISVIFSRPTGALIVSAPANCLCTLPCSC